MKLATLTVAALALMAMPAVSMAQQGPTPTQQKHITGKDRGGELTPKTGATMDKMDKDKMDKDKMEKSESMDKSKMEMDKNGTAMDKTTEKGTSGQNVMEDANRGRNKASSPAPHEDTK